MANKEDGIRLYIPCPSYIGPFTYLAPTASRLWDFFYFIISNEFNAYLKKSSILCSETYRIFHW